MGMVDDSREAGGLRRSNFKIIPDDDIDYLKTEIYAINADISIFRFNTGYRTGYIDDIDRINIMGDVFPDPYSTHPRDRMSVRAVLAHEYYGHRAFRGTIAQKGSWNDEFRASYSAAKIAPGLSDEDRMYLMLDAIQRTKDSGVTIKFNSFMRRILYGND